MEAFRLSVRDCISFGWRTFKSRPWLFLGVTLLTMAISMLIPGPSGDERWYVQVAIGIASFLVTTLLNLGIKNFTLHAHDDVAEARYAHLWHPQLYPHYFGASVLIGVIVVVGIILLIVPGIIAGMAFGLGTYVVVDRGFSPVAALKESARITKGNRWRLLLLYLALIGLNILGLLAVIVGILVTLPVSGLALAHAYRTLSAQAEDIPADVEAREVSA